MRPMTAEAPEGTMLDRLATKTTQLQTSSKRNTKYWTFKIKHKKAQPISNYNNLQFTTTQTNNTNQRLFATPLQTVQRVVKAQRCTEAAPQLPRQGVTTTTSDCEAIPVNSSPKSATEQMNRFGCSQKQVLKETESLGFPLQGQLR